MSASPKSVCVPCRRVYKGEGRRATTERQLATIEGPRPRPEIRRHGFKGVGHFPKKWMGNGAGMHDAPETCPECGGATVPVWYGWRPPKRRNRRAWGRIERGDWLTEENPHGRAPRFENNPNWKKGQRS